MFPSPTLILGLTLTSFCAFGTLLSGPVAAQTTIGTTLNGAQANTDFVSSSDYYGQVFTVPTDNVLNTFSVQVANESPLSNFSIYAFNLTAGFATDNAAGYTTGGPLYSSGPVVGVTVPTGYLPFTAQEDTYQTGGLTLTPGGTYLALIQNITPAPAQTEAPLFFDSMFSFQHYPGYNYDPSGACVFGSSPTGLFAQGFDGSDLAFRASFGPAAIPEASSTVSFGLLLALGLGSVIAAARKKRSPASACSTRATS